MPSKSQEAVALQALTASSGQDAVALQALSALPGGYLPWTGAAMHPAAVATVVNSVVLNDHRVIVECGSGVSTVVLARVVRQEGGHIYTIEEDAEWGAHVSAWLDRDGTADAVTIIHAPFEGKPGDGWYRRAALVDIPAEIDLLVVDGPAALAPGRALVRYPALPYFHEKLAPGATVVLDDISRPGEQQILARWRSEFGREFEVRPLSDIAISRGGAPYDV
jgi:predicted O-methyltransferase YrrM